MKFCIYCGAKNADDARFCAKCGKSVDKTDNKSLVKTDQQDKQHFGLLIAGMVFLFSVPVVIFSNMNIILIILLVPVLLVLAIAMFSLQSAFLRPSDASTSTGASMVIDDDDDDDDDNEKEEDSKFVGVTFTYDRRPTTVTRSRSESNTVKYASIYANASLKSIANFVVLDTETTGLGNRDKIIEVGLIRYENHKPVDSYVTFVYPEMPIPKVASDINGITDDMIADAPVFAEIADKVRGFIGSGPVVGHNISYDLRMLRQSGFSGLSEDVKVYDTLSIARKTIDAPNNKLDTLCTWFGICREEEHRCLSDCHDTARIFQKLFEIKTGKTIPLG